MDITEIPFNRFIGIIRSERTDGSLLELDQSMNLANHLDTMHAGAQFALAEAASGECLLRKFSDLASTASLIPVVREVRVKYRKPAMGTVRARAIIRDDDAVKAIESLSGKGRAIIPVDVAVSDEANNTTLTATFTWFVQKAKCDE